MPKSMEQPTYIEQSIAHFGLDVIEIQTVEESYSSTVNILLLANGEKRVLKIPFNRQKLLREIQILKILQGNLPVPAVEDYWIADNDIAGALLLSWLPGQPVAGTITSELSYKLGALLGELHTHRLEAFGEVTQAPENASSQDWWQSLDQFFSHWKPLCEQVLPASLFEKAVKQCEELRAHLPEPDGPCVIHFDYRPGNVLVQDDEITGLIDFESSRGGSADLDFVKIKTYVWDAFPGTKQSFIEGYASIRDVPDIERSLPFYELMNAFGGIAWCVKRNKIEDPFFTENLEKLRQLLGE